MLDVTISWAADLLHHVAPSSEPPAIPQPGKGEEPPGAAKFEMLLGWLVWAALGASVGGLTLIGARMGINHKRGEAGSHMGSIGIVGIGAALIVGAPAIILKLAG